jgi:hypothetical protein
MPYMQHPARDALQLMSDPILQNPKVRARTRQKLNRHSLPFKAKKPLVPLLLHNNIVMLDPLFLS